ncbi:MAG: glycosyltransferase family 8 protein [Bryobacteraceae bacterium]|nr:glycosyltransferase family 8 protein [Bryobacteraceae bacterium]
MQRDSLTLATAINARYTLPLIVVLLSLRAHLRPSTRPVLYLVQSGLPEAHLEILRGLIELRLLQPTPEQLALVPSDARFPREAAMPLLLPLILPEHLDRVLFIDADTLVLDDLTPLAEVDFGDSTLAAVPDAAIPSCAAPRGVKTGSRYHIPPGRPYFNAGILLMEIQRWRTRDLTPLALDYLRETGEEVDFLHQEALNAVAWNQWVPLEPRWNLVASLAGRSYGPPLPASDLQHPAIVHFSGRFKPWLHPVGGPFASRYAHFLDQALRLLPGGAQPSLRDRFYGLYDRRIRRHAYWLEHALWKRRIL